MQVCFFFTYKGENLAYVRWLVAEEGGDGDGESSRSCASSESGSEVEGCEDERGGSGGGESGTDSSNAGDTGDEAGSDGDNHGYQQRDGDDTDDADGDTDDADGEQDDADADSNPGADDATSSASSDLSEDECFPRLRWRWQSKRVSGHASPIAL